MSVNCQFSKIFINLFRLISIDNELFVYEILGLYVPTLLTPLELLEENYD
ncbi:MAG: hypothetical protein HW421_3488 [Ignavibacteria bacterium]|nr:hypothetical protein [Ignavibacteria bacterium]